MMVERGWRVFGCDALMLLLVLSLPFNGLTMR